MKLTKLLAMLLALCMVLCCFAACGGDNKDDDKDEKTEATDEKKEESKKEEETTEAPKADAGLEGTWMMDIDLGEAFMGMMEAEEMELTVPALDFGIEWTFEEDGKFSATAVEFPDDEAVYDFYMSFMEMTLDAIKDMFEGEDLEAYLADMGYETWDEYVAASVQDAADMMVETMHEEPVVAEGEYELDGDVIKINDEISGAEVEITFDINENEMKFVEVEDEYDEFSVYKDAILIKK